LLDLQLLLKAVSSLGYVGALIAGLLGSSSLFISIFPSYIVIAVLGATLNPILVGLLGGVGAGVGQFLHYYIGLGGRYLMPGELERQVRCLAEEARQVWCPLNLRLRSHPPYTRRRDLDTARRDEVPKV
jgi:membrane protein DedA with SNARE-associated domain